MTTLKVSDRVKTRIGTHGTIVRIVDNNRTIVRFPAYGMTLTFRMENLTLVEPHCIFKEVTCQDSQEDKLFS